MQISLHFTIIMKKAIFALGLATLSLVSCTTSNIHQSLGQPEIKLAQGNYRVVATQLTGSSIGFHAATFLPTNATDIRAALQGGPLGGFPVKSASESAALDEMYRNAGDLRGRATAFVNLRTEVSGLNCLLFSFPKVTVKADLIEFDRPQ